MERIIFRTLGVLLCAGASALWAQQYVISTIAGGGLPLGPMAASNFSIGSPSGVAADSAGNVYFTVTNLNCAFKVDQNGVLTRIAGNSRAGFAGDGGPAVNAQLNSPSGIAVDGSGNLFIADHLNNRIRKVSSGGMITTVAGTGSLGESGDEGPALNAQLFGPAALALDSSGNLFFAEDRRVRKISLDGIIMAVAGTGVQDLSGDSGPAINAEFWFLGGLAIDKAGNLFIADTGSARVRKVSRDGIITTVAGNGTSGYSGDGGQATGAQISATGLATNSAGDLFICGGNRVRKVSTDGTISTVAGNGAQGSTGDGGPAINAQVFGPGAAAIDSGGDLLLTEPGRIRQISHTGIITTVAGNGFYSFSGDGGLAASAQLDTPWGVALDTSGNLFIADTLNNRVRKVSTSGVITTVAGSSPSCPGPFFGPCGDYSGDGGTATGAQLHGPTGVAVDRAGNLFIADSGNNRIREVSLDGIIKTVGGNAGLANPGGVVVDRAGNLFIADGWNSRVLKMAPDGTITTVAGSAVCPATDVCYSGDGGPGIDAQLTGPTGIAVDGAGNLFIADPYIGRVRRVSLDGIITTVAGGGASSPGDGGPAISAKLSGPRGVAIDNAGNLFIADSVDNAGNPPVGFLDSNRVRKVSPDGIITTIAGNGASGYSGDGGPATNAQLNVPRAVAVDSAGNVYVADSGNNAIRLLQPVGPPFSSALSVKAATSAASNLAGAVSPGEIVVLYGSGIGPVQLAAYQLDAAGQIATTLATTRVLLNGVPAPIVYAWSTQVAGIVPYETDGATVQVQVSYQGQTSEPITIPLAASAPAIFSLDSTGKGQAAAINQDLSYNDAAHPAPVGSVISLYATGEGQTSPAGSDGQVAGATLPQPVLPVSVTIGGISAAVQYAGGAPGEVAGLMQVNVLIPPGVQPGGAVPVRLTVGKASSQPGITVAVVGPPQ